MRAKMLLTLAAFAVIAFGGFVAGAHDQDGSSCNGANHRHTAAGSCKDTDDRQISCGDHGSLPVVSGTGINVSVNQSGDNAQVEACSDSGSGNQHGRLMVEADQSEQGVRAILDSDPDQPFPAGWITAQVSGKSGNASGLYCSRDAGESGAVEGDGYAQSWANPGPDTGADCVPNPPAAR